MPAPDRLTLPRLLAAFALLAFCLLAALEGVVHSLPNHWNGIRLLPLFAWTGGHPLYLSANSGPAMSTIYGPVMFIAYLPLALIRDADAYRWTVLGGSFLSLAYALLPAALVIRNSGATPMIRRASWALVLAAPMVFFPLRLAAFDIHADAPGIALLGLAAWGARMGTARGVLLAGLCCALAAFAKQTYLLAAGGVGFYLWVTAGVRPALRFLVSLGVSGTVLLGTSLLVFGVRPFWDCVVMIPTSHPWKQISLSGVEAGDGSVTPVQKLASFWGMGVVYFKAYPLAALAPLVVIARAWFQKSGPRFTPGWPLLLALVALASLPGALLGTVKAAGYLNNLALPLYFGLLALLAWALESREPGARVALGTITAGVVGVLLPGLLGSATWSTLAQPLDAERIIVEAQAAPGLLACPQNPFTIYLADGRVTTDGYSLQDRAWAGQTDLAPIARAGFSTEHPTILVGSTKFLAPYLGETKLAGALPGTTLSLTIVSP